MKKLGPTVAVTTSSFLHHPRSTKTRPTSTILGDTRRIFLSITLSTWDLRVGCATMSLNYNFPSKYRTRSPLHNWRFPMG